MSQDHKLQPGSPCLFLSGVNPKPDVWLHGKVVEWTPTEKANLPAILNTHYCIEVSPVYRTWPRRVFRKYEDVKQG